MLANGNDGNVCTQTSIRLNVKFTWDERKNGIKRRKHGVSFEAACLVFADPYHLSRQDREVEGEARWQTIGMAGGLHVLLVAHTVTDPGEHGGEEVVRIISARKATPQERRIYAEGI